MTPFDYDELDRALDTLASIVESLCQLQLLYPAPRIEGDETDWMHARTEARKARTQIANALHNARKA